MATGLSTWSQTAASNATADSNVNWAEGQAPSSVNDSARAMMASMAKWRDDNNGTLTTAGTTTAYTVTSNQSFASLTALSGNTLRIKFNATNGASPTLAVDGLTAKAIVTKTGTAVATGYLKANNIYDLVYANGSTEFILINGSATISEFAATTAMVFYQTAAPTNWTAVAVNDKALRVVSATGGVTGGTTAFSSVFASRTIAKANLPSYNLTVTNGTFSLAVNGAALSSGTNTGASFNTFNTSGVNYGAIDLTVASGGSGTAMDFAVQYADVLICTKD